MLITEKKLTAVDNFISFIQELWVVFANFTPRISNESKPHEAVPRLVTACDGERI
jgi:hypothetical protein